MHLYLLRHADAETPAAHDDERRLSEKGIDQAKRAGRFCRDHAIAPDLILTSPLVRARETAEHCAAGLESTQVQVAAFLASGMEPPTALAELKAFAKFEHVMIVGHEPDFSRLIAHLLELPESGHLHIRKGSLTLLEVGALRPGAARLTFSIPARFM